MEGKPVSQVGPHTHPHCPLSPVDLQSAPWHSDAGGVTIWRCFKHAGMREAALGWEQVCPRPVGSPPSSCQAKVLMGMLIIVDLSSNKRVTLLAIC